MKMNGLRVSGLFVWVELLMGEMIVCMEVENSDSRWAILLVGFGVVRLT